MPVRTAAQYMESLKDDRSIYIEGERIKDVTKDNRFVGAAETMAELLQMQHEKDLKEVLTYNSPTSGESVGMSHIQPKSKEDIKARGDAMKVWMDATCGMLGRSPDYKNVMVSALLLKIKIRFLFSEIDLIVAVIDLFIFVIFFFFVNLIYFKKN